MTSGRPNPVDGVAIDRCVNTPEPVPLNNREAWEAFLILEERGLIAEEIAKRIGRTKRHVFRCRQKLRQTE